MDSRDIEKWRVELDSYAHVEDGVEYWLARDLMEPMGYTRWENFAEVIKRAKVSCETNKTPVDSHFRDTTKMVTAGVAARAVKDYKLTRYACYLIAQNGDSRKPQVAFAQTYFAVQTRKAEVIEQRLLDCERLKAREKLSQTEKQLSGILYERGIDNKGFAIIRSKGDQALFNLSTQMLKKRMNVPTNRPIADFLPTISIKAKDLATEMTNVNVQAKDLYGQSPIEKEHIDNNTAVRDMLLQRGIKPEQLSPNEDIKKVQRRINKDNKKNLKNK